MTPRDLAIQELARLFEEQRDFDSQLRNPTPADPIERRELTKGIVLHLVHQASRLLESSGAWKLHRRGEVLENKPRVALDVADLFKLTMMLANAWGITPEEFLDAAWEKSMIVRQKHAEDWVLTLSGPLVLVDIDNVLADYTGGLIAYLEEKEIISADVGERLLRSDRLIDELDLNISTELWQKLKHDFRVRGLKRRLRPIPGARDFLHWCRAQGWTVVLITSRPIATYPNIYNDTLSWLRLHGMEFDYIWWAENKAERLPIDLIEGVQFAVDDDARFCQQYMLAGVRSYWLRHRSLSNEGLSYNPLVQPVLSFAEIVEKEEANVVR